MADPNTDEGAKKSHTDLHPHFIEPPRDQDDLNAHDSQILVDRINENALNIRLGFLQIKHVYEVRFSIEDSLGEDVIFDPLENLHAKIESANPSEDGKGHDIVLIFSAAKEKIMRETLTIRSKAQESESLTLTFHARVLGKGKGHPSLKLGIHCIRIECDDESDEFETNSSASPEYSAGGQRGMKQFKR